MTEGPIAARVRAFCAEYGMQIPILMAPMAGACPPELAAAVANAGGLGACGALLMTPDQIADWAASHRAASNGGFQMNLWIPDPDPARDPAHEARLRAFLGGWGPEVAAEAGDQPGQDFEAQTEAILQAGPAIISSIMGVYPDKFVQEFKRRGMRWFATATTVREACAARDAGADVIVAQGAEAGGHRGAFDAARAQSEAIGLMALLPAVVDAVDLPVVATGGIADGRGAAAALALGASAVQIGTGLLRCPEAGTHPTWAEALSQTNPEDTALTRAFSGRSGRAIRTDYVTAAQTGPEPAPYPVQRNLTGPMRAEAAQTGDLNRMQAWAGQAAGLAQARPAGALVTDIWADARQLLGLSGS